MGAMPKEREEISSGASCRWRIANIVHEMSKGIKGLGYLLVKEKGAMRKPFH
jgi:hypothetical protein